MPDQESHHSGSAPVADRPYMPEGYGVPATTEGMLPWSHVSERMTNALNYWIGTTRPDGRPHAVPVWGAWVDETFYFEGGHDTRRGRNLAVNPAVVVHIEIGADIVILEGVAEQIVGPEPGLAARLAEAFAAKYGETFDYRPAPDAWDQGGLYVVRPRVALAWNEFPKSATRWKFTDG